MAGTLILDGQGNSNAVFIFRFGGAFTTGAGSTITLVNGALAGNVFWIADGAIAMAATTTMEGILVANGAISMGAGGVLHGRMFSLAGAASIYTTTAAVVPERQGGGTVSPNQTICPGTAPMNLTLAGNTGTVVKWQKSTTSSFTSATDINITSSTLTSADIGNLTAVTYFRAQVQTGLITTEYSSYAIVGLNLSTSINFGAASTFALFSSSGAVSNVGTSTITGNVGTNSGAITGFTSPTTVNGIVHTPDSITAQAVTDLLAAYTELANTATTNTSHTAAFGAGETLTAGVYSVGTASSVSGTLILDGQGDSNSQFIFKIGGALTSAVNTTVTLINGAYAGNVYWIAEGAIAMGATTTNEGTFISHGAAASVGAGGVFKGRLYSTLGAVSMNTTVIETIVAANSGTVSSNQIICAGTQPASLVLTGNTAGVIRWERSTISDFSDATAIASSGTTLGASQIGNLSTTTYFRAVVYGGVCAVSYSAYATVTVNAASLGGTVSNDQAICSGTSAVSLTLAGNVGSVVKWQKSTDTNFTAPVDINNITTTLNAAAIGILSATTYFRSVIQSATCAAATSDYVTITVLPVSVGGIISSDQALCGGILAQDLTLSLQSGDVVKWQKSSDSSFTSPIDINNITPTLNSGDIGILSSTTYYRAIVQNGTCSSAVSNYATILLSSTTWNGSSWTNGAPTTSSSVTIAGNYSPTLDISFCSMKVTNNAAVVISALHNITLNGSLTVEAGSSFTLKNNANLVQISDAANTGEIIVKRDSNQLMRLDYTLWSSPVEGQELQSFSIGTLANRFYTYNSGNNLYTVVASPSTTNFEPATGYLIRIPNTQPTTPLIWTGTFKGKPNNGSFYEPVINQTYNAVGNPYPSPIDANLFISENNISEALYLWRKTNNSSMTSYATYTTAGGVCNGNLQADPLALTPNGIIQIGQGFILKSNTTNIHFSNSMRINNIGNQIFRNASESRSRIWLNLTGNSGVFSQTMIAYMPTATTGIDPAVDGRYFDDSQTALTSLIGLEEFAIQGRPAFDASDVVPLGFKTTTVYKLLPEL